MALICFDGMNLRPKKSMLESSEKCLLAFGGGVEGAPFYCKGIWVNLDTFFWLNLSIFRSP